MRTRRSLAQAAPCAPPIVMVERRCTCERSNASARRAAGRIDTNDRRRSRYLTPRTWRLVVLATHPPLILGLPAPQAARTCTADASGSWSGYTGIACAEEVTASANATDASFFIAVPLCFARPPNPATRRFGYRRRASRDGSGCCRGDNIRHQRYATCL